MKMTCVAKPDRSNQTGWATPPVRLPLRSAEANMETFDIVLPKRMSPRFPDRCVYSGERGADDSVLVIANGQNPISSFFSPLLLLFGWKSVRAPILRRHKWKYYFFSYGRDVVMVALVFLFIFAVMPMLDGNDPNKRIKGAVIVLLMLSPWIAFEVLFPRRFDITMKKDSISYEFSHEDVAEEFAELNLNDR
ncbi:hypothetical protein [Puniceicoccus vermicola]|uniref:Uncharacterized protein n=1 Tax=Puniceicoccus vermicola TaxID=388746 RepID=A0A7X1B138_9BACT|nr:hypothetical protein [Puniceicoccus vermicola]MBC2603691.1 hypothetical protein [Puniceicoccus vermicola]